MKKFWMVMSLIALTSNAFATSIVAKNRNRDPRVLRIDQKKNGKYYFHMCTDSSLHVCHLIGHGGFTEKELKKKISGERLNMIAKTTGIVVMTIPAAVVGGVLGASAAGAAGLAIYGGASIASAAFVYNNAFSMMGRSPINEYKSIHLLELTSQGDHTVVVRNLEKVHQLYTDLLWEVERQRE
jgi:hypothetical protein